MSVDVDNEQAERDDAIRDISSLEPEQNVVSACIKIALHTAQTKEKAGQVNDVAHGIATQMKVFITMCDYLGFEKASNHLTEAYNELILTAKRNMN